MTMKNAEHGVDLTGSPATVPLEERTVPAVSPRDLPAFVARLRERQGIAALAVEFAILTTAAMSEVRGAYWADFDLEAGIWRIPSWLRLSGVPRQLPLSEDAIEVLECIGRSGDLVFGGSNGCALTYMELDAVIRTMNLADKGRWVDAASGARVVAGGFRRTFRMWAIEIADYDPGHVQCVLNGPDKPSLTSVGTLDIQRRILEHWADFTFAADLPS